MNAWKCEPSPCGRFNIYTFFEGQKVGVPVRFKIGQVLTVSPLRVASIDTWRRRKVCLRIEPENHDENVACTRACFANADLVREGCNNGFVFCSDFAETDLRTLLLLDKVDENLAAYIDGFLSDAPSLPVEPLPEEILFNPTSGKIFLDLLSHRYPLSCMPGPSKKFFSSKRALKNFLLSIRNVLSALPTRLVCAFWCPDAVLPPPNTPPRPTRSLEVNVDHLTWNPKHLSLQGDLQGLNPLVSGEVFETLPGLMDGFSKHFKEVLQEGTHEAIQLREASATVDYDTFSIQKAPKEVRNLYDTLKGVAGAVLKEIPAGVDIDGSVLRMTLYRPNHTESPVVTCPEHSDMSVVTLATGTAPGFEISPAGHYTRPQDLEVSSLLCFPGKVLTLTEHVPALYHRVLVPPYSEQRASITFFARPSLTTRFTNNATHETLTSHRLCNLLNDLPKGWVDVVHEAGTMSHPVRTGTVIGYGRAGHIHMGNLSKMDDVRVKYIVDPCEDTKVPEGVKHVTSLEAALCDEEVDFVVVCSPTWSHYEDISKSLKAGKHVFAEKPLCTETAQISLVYGDAAESGKLLFTAFNRRYDPFLMNAKKRYESGEAGGVLSGMMVSRDYPYPVVEYLKISGNLFKDCVVHDLDCMIWLLGETPVSVTATARSPGTERAAGMIESSQVFLKFASGKVITLMSSRVSKSYDQRLELYCQKDDIIVSNPVSEAPLTFAERYRESYVNEMREFIDSVNAGVTTPNLPLGHSLLLDTLIKACHESVDTGREVAISV